jgi:outer membrane protein assembly factor BamB
MSSPRNHLYLGIGGYAVAVDRSTGEEIWRRKLKSQTYVTLYCDGDSLYAGCAGELFCLDPATGELRWHNKLPRLGQGLICFSGANESILSSGTEAANVSAMAATTAATAAVIAAT